VYWPKFGTCQQQTQKLDVLSTLIDTQERSQDQRVNASRVGKLAKSEKLSLNQHCVTFPRIIANQGRTHGGMPSQAEPAVGV
jgi:hypothetical protein